MSLRADQMLDPPFSPRLWSLPFSEQDQMSLRADQMLDLPFSPRLSLLPFSEQDQVLPRVV